MYKRDDILTPLASGKGTRSGKQNDLRAEERYYSNSEIIIIEDLKEIPKFNKEFKLGMTALLLCEEGELSVVIDGIKYEVKKGSFIICSSFCTSSIYASSVFTEKLRSSRR